MASQPLLGAIFMFGGNFAPRGYALCNGQTIAISQNTALFSILGTTYGGNGTTTFQLPDFRGRVPISQGQGPGLNNYVLGEQDGAETVTLTSNEMPIHSHRVNAASQQTSDLASGNFPADGGAYGAAASAGNQFAPATLATSGGGLPHNNLQPLLAVNFIIALQGIFPSRN